MKKKLQFLFSVMVLMCLSVVANAQDAQEPEFSYQKYLVQNVASGMYWAAGNGWGTQASLVVSPEYLKLEPVMEGDPATWKGTYYIESQVNQAGHYFNGDYMDQTPPVEVIVKAVEGGYTIANGDNYYGWDGSSTVLGKNLAADSPNAVWTIVSLADAKAGLSAATAEKPIDATFLIEDHDFGRNNRYVNNWTAEGVNNISGGNNTNNCAESFHSVFTISQVLDGAPAGIYALAAQGFYRQDGTDNDNLPVIFANDETSTFPLKTGSENGMGDASASFSAGKYAIDPVFVEVPEGGSLTVGAKLVTNTNLWCIWDNFTLKYYGTDANIEQLKNAALFEEVAELKTKAADLAGQITNETVLTALQGAIASAEGVATADAAKEAKTALTNAITKANNYLSAKAAIDAHYAVLNGTNVATAAATETFKGLIDGWNEANEAGTLTETVVMPAAYGWRGANPIDDFLLSAWSVGETKCQEYDAPMYINTWSTEGNADGSEFRVPFFEYWTNDGNSLGANDLTATLEGITEGNYAVEAFVRVRMKNAATAPAYGITLQANDGEAANVCDGTQFGSQFFVKNVRVPAVVGADGKLVVKFSVAADNNISWLSFQNVKYITAEEAAQKEIQENYEAAVAAIQDGNYYQISTKVGENTYYLKSDGKLTADEAEATAFPFTAVKASGTLYETGWNVGYPFTNPNLTGGSTGDVKNEGYIRTNGANRNDWERQAFFLNDEGLYAVRATNANSANWGANTYWTALEGAELPNAGYSLNFDYRWTLTDVTAKGTLAAAQKVVDAKEGVGDALFFIPEEAYNTYAGVVSAAAAIINDPASTAEQVAQALADLNAATATYEASVLKPAADKQYTIQLKAGGNYMSIDNGGIKLSADEYPFTLEEVEGGYALTNGSEYVALAGGNAWDMTASSTAYAWVISPTAEGYTIAKSTGTGFIGMDATEAGSTCYADKGPSNKNPGNYVWSITEYVAPEIADLTADMFHKWTLVDPIEISVAEQPCAFGLFQETGDVYGDMSVNPDQYADLTDWDYLSIAGIGGTPRLIFNRTADLTQTEGSEEWKGTIPLQIQDTESPYIVSAENDIYVYDLKKIKEDFGGFVHLNCIKVANWGKMTTHAIKLSTVKPAPLAWYTITVDPAIENGTVAAAYEKTVEGVPVKVTAVADDGFDLEALAYTVEGSEEAVEIENGSFNMPASNVTIAASFAKGPEYVYTDLTADMFACWTTADADAEETGDDPNCAYVLGESTGLPYGNGSVEQFQFADLSDFAKLTLTVTEGTPRLLFNTQGEDPNKQFIEINSADNKYVTTLATDEGTKWIIDLAAIVADTETDEADGFAHLNCIKANGWGNTVTITEMELAALVQVPEIALNCTGFNFEEGTQAEPNIQPAGSKLTINWSAENLEENLVTEDAVQVKMTVMVSGDLPENMMTMGSTTAHRVLDETFYVGLGEQDFPVELKPGYVYQNIAVMAAELVLPGDEETPEVSLAAYAGEPIQLHWVGVAAEEEEEDPEFIEIAQDQGKDIQDGAGRSDLVEGDDYNTYTANGTLTVAFKMFDIDVAGCDYVTVKFAEPLPAGWYLAFWGKNDNHAVSVPAGTTEYSYNWNTYTEYPSAVENDVLPQICLLTIFDEVTYPIEAKVEGVYKHLIPSKQDIAVERMVGQGYTAQTEEIDFSTAAAYLGVDAITYDMLRMVEPDGSLSDNYGPDNGGYDGWFNAEGAKTWSNINGAGEKGVCIKLSEAINGEGYYPICDMGNPAVGDVFNVKWAAVANDKTFYFNYKVTFVEYVEPEYKPEIVKTIEIAAIDQAGAAYKDASHPSFDVAEVCEALGIEDITSAKTYIVNVTTGNFVENTTDGWRSAEGDAQAWTQATNGYCLKLDDPASGEFNYNGAHDANFAEGDTYVAQWGIVANEKAVLLKVTFTFLSEADFTDVMTGINGVAGSKAKTEGRKYIEDGKVYIFRNGKKVLVSGIQTK